MNDVAVARLIGETVGHEIAHRAIELLETSLKDKEMPVSTATIKDGVEEIIDAVLEAAADEHTELLSRPENKEAFLKTVSESFNRTFSRMSEATANIPITGVQPS